ncbi:type II toxin-antitoxin system RelE/ParE family toxin [Luteibacter sp. 9133]|uniref:type II toxin-antitoxin system RelE/ParE family toxin n=1 Tax=Luteibacter sp. 9133 TaxID=1500891 RepID=UPI0005BE5402|nr:type II toxin-antitoxin system RelE/ParE family toxin [Luteibacter sp. 9133]
MNVLKRRDFARWQRRHHLDDAALCQAIGEMERGLVDADLGGALYKKRIAREGGGKRGGYRTLLAAQMGSRYVFLHGFLKSDVPNVTSSEKRALQCLGYTVLSMSTKAVAQALKEGSLLEVRCDKQDHRIRT